MPFELVQRNHVRLQIPLHAAVEVANFGEKWGRRNVAYRIWIRRCSLFQITLGFLLLCVAYCRIQ